jgi:hypothetical protein
MRYFIAVYTNKVKMYTDQQFFRALGVATRQRDCFIKIVDNSQDKNYIKRLDDNMAEWLGHDKFSISYQFVDYQPRETLFLRSVCDSVNYLRKLFLTAKAEKFIIVESDVIVPPNLIELFGFVEDKADIIGGIYYRDFHNLLLFDPACVELVEATHVLSGCTMYDKKVIKQFHFRWDKNNTAEFPDSWISADALAAGYRLRNYAAVKCDHLENSDGSGRGMNNL